MTKPATGLSLLVIILLTLAMSSNGHDISDSVRLLDDKLSDYNKMLRPIRNQSDTLTVQIGLDLVSIQEFEEKDERISYTGILIMLWKDELFTWDPDKYGGVKNIEVDSTRLWIPHITNTNAVGSVDQISNDWQMVNVTYQGFVTYGVGNVFTSSCHVDVTYYPWDRQSCEFNFLLVNYDLSKLAPWPFSKTVMTNFYEENRAWQLLNSSITTDGTITIFRIELGRRPQFVIVNIILPMILLSFLGVFNFLIPIESGERISFCLTVLLSIAVFLTLVSETLPRVSEPMSYFSFYLVSVLIINVCATLATIINLRFYFADEEDKPGRFWTCFAGGILCRCNTKNTKAKAKTEQTYTDGQGKSPSVNDTNRVLRNGSILCHNNIGSHGFTMDDIHTDFENNSLGDDVNNIKKLVTWKNVSTASDRFLFVLFLLCLIADTVIFFTTISSGS